MNENNNLKEEPKNTNTEILMRHVSYENEMKKLKYIRNTSIVSLVVSCFSLIFLSLWIIFIMDPWLFMSDTSWNSWINTTGILLWIFEIVFWVILVVCFVINIINAIKIFSTNWRLQSVEDNKVVWGVFTIILLGSISSLIFSVTSINKFKEVMKQ